MEDQILEIYTESTPNPESIKFVTSRFLLKGAVAEFKSMADAKEKSPLATMLFEIPFIQQVFISNHYISITKKQEYEWFEITPEIKQSLKEFILSGKEMFSIDFYKSINHEHNTSAKEEVEIDDQIKALLEKYVKPAVEMDGGHIAFKSFENGIVTLLMQGACSGCPSSSATLKNGVEGLLKRMIPEVVEVVAEAG
jgi:NFU1 iron-sulfur cluster scaffold homolog, mitochondrial